MSSETVERALKEERALCSRTSMGMCTWFTPTLLSLEALRDFSKTEIRPPGTCWGQQGLLTLAHLPSAFAKPFEYSQQISSPTHNKPIDLSGKPKHRRLK